MSDEASPASPAAIRDGLARIWQEELAVAEVRDEDDFFGQGGHSALAVQVALRLRQLLRTDVELDILYLYPEFGKLAVALAAEVSGAAAAEQRELSAAEERIWFVEQVHRRTPVYHISVLYRFDGKLDVGRLRQAFAALAERHKALRTGFRKPGVAVVLSAAPVPVRQVDVAGATELTVSRLLDSEARQPFELDRPPLIRALVAGRGEAGDWLLITAHHLVCDGASLDLIEADLRRAYDGDASESDGLGVPVVQAVTQQPLDLDTALDYWRGALAGLPSVSSFPYDRPRPKALGVAGAVHRAEVPARALAALDRLAEQEGLSPFMVWAAAFGVGLAAATGERDLAVVTPVSMRGPEQVTEIGMLVNTVPLRHRLPPEATARTAARVVRRAVAGALAYSGVPMQAMIEQLGLGGDLSRVPLGQTTLTYLDDSGWSWRLGGLSATRELYPTGTTKYELTWMVTRQATGVGAVLEYNSDLFSPEAASRLHERMVAAITAAFARPDTEILAAVAEEAAADQADEPAVGQRLGYRSITELIASRARERADSVALIHNDVELSYAELNQRAASVAAGLRRSGVGRGDIVAIPMTRSASSVTAILGALRAGCAYLPLDVNLPPARMRMLIEQCRPVAAIADAAEIAESIAGLVPVLMVDGLLAQDASGGLDERPVAVTEQDPACVICTSGSTGQPKAVIVPHGAISALVPAANYLTFTPDDRVAYESNPAFDAVLIEIWGALTSGATLVVVDREVALTPRRMRELLAEQRISVMVMATSLFNQIADFEPDAFAGMRALFFGGEVADPRRLEKLLTGSPPPRVVNVYGPTENTTATTMHDITLADVAGVVPIGRPVSGAVLYLLGPDGALVEPGEAGELYVGGAGLANGYHLAPAMTAAAFVPDPFGAAGGRLYRTGDFVRQLPDGSFTFIGRNDDQVKIRGFRVELGEIDLAIRRQEHVGDAAVLSRRTPDGAEVVAFVSGTASLDGAELTRRLRQELPDHMVPVIVVLDAMPMSSNGKIDRRALADAMPVPGPSTVPEPAAGPVSASTVAEEAQGDGALMASMAELWQEILGVGQVGPDDDFIALGGQSIKALRLLARVDEAFGVQLNLAEVLSNPTLLAVTGLVTAALEEDAEEEAAQEEAAQEEAAQDEAAGSLPVPDPVPVTLARFLGEVRAHPEAPALEDEQGRLTYAELLATAQATASQLEAQGVVPGSLVAVECGYGRDYVIALLAVWLRGATAVPLDPASPAERRLYQVRRAGCDAAMTGPESDGVVAAEVAGREPAGLDETTGSAYVLFTSGSTGQPKGVVVEHAGLVAMLDCVAGRMGLGRGDAMVAHSNPVFDMSMFETVLPMVTGGCLAVAPPRSARNPEIFAKWLLASPVDAAIATPSQLRLLLPFLTGRAGAGRPVRKLISGGEALTVALTQDLQAACEVLWNAYGPTEASIIATCAEVTPPWQDPMPIGHVVDGLTAHVLDESLRPVPAGEPGELCLSGPGLARCYVADPGETARAFVTGPGGVRVYRTGDIVAVRADGQYCFQGRRDDQVKVRGHRVELGEIEAVAQRDPSVALAAAVSCDVLHDQPELYLAVAMAPGHEPAASELREHLRRLLPAHMLPSKVLYFDELPTNTSGKVDRLAVRKLVESRLT